MNELKKVIDTLDEAADSFDGIATKEQKKIYDEVITLAKDLDTDALGRVRQSIANLKRLTLIKAKLAALSKDKEWVSGIGKFLQYFGTLQKQQNAYFSAHFPQATLSKSAKEKNELMRQLAIQNTTEALMGDGLKANVTDKLNDILLRAVTTNAKFADLQEELRAHLMGQNGGQGAFARYATTYATTALSQFTGQQNKLLSEDLDTEWFMYTGSNKETTRELCEQLTKKKYIHKSEIPTILTGRIDEYQCDIYEKTGLPYGMIAGTTPDNFQCNCGGWNCRHQLVPVADAVVPANLRAKFKQIRPTALESERPSTGPDAFNEYMKGKYNLTEGIISWQINEFQKEGVSFKIDDSWDIGKSIEEWNRALTDYNNIIAERAVEKMMPDEKKMRKDIDQEIMKFAKVSPLGDMIRYSYKSDPLKAIDGIVVTERKKSEILLNTAMQEGVKLPGSKDVKSFDYKLTMNGDGTDAGIVRDVHIYETKSGTKIIMPADMDLNKQHISISQLFVALEKLPKNISSHIKELRLLDIVCPEDPYWKVKYNDPNHVSFATDGEIITFFENAERFGPGEKNAYFVFDTIAHETGHKINKERRIVDGGYWAAVVKRDKEFNKEKDVWISEYARRSQSLSEDFADSVKLYCVLGASVFKMRYPYRYTFLTKKCGI